MAPTRTVSVRLLGDVGQYVAAVGKDAVKATKDFNSELDVLGKQHKDKFNQVATAGAAMGVGLLGVFGAVEHATLGFDKQMSAVASVVDGNAKSLDDLRGAAIKAGKDTVFSATEAAKAEEELAKAGVSTSDIMGGALTGSLSLASAGSLELGDAATIAAQAMNIWGLKGAAVGHIADVLASGANTSAADVNQLGLAMKQGGLIAAQTGLSFEQTIGVLSAFADHALVGSDAGTSLKTMLQALQAPSTQARALMEKLGISLYDTKGQFVGIAAFAEQLHTALSGLTEAERAHAMAQIFGTDATRSATILYNLGADGVNKYTDAVDKNGAASETARKKLDNLSGDVEQLKGSLETLAITSGTGANQGLRVLTQAATGAVNAFLGLPAPIQETVTILSGVGGAGILAATGFLKARQSSMELMSNLRDMGPVGSKVADGLAKVGKVGGAVGLAAIATFGLYEGLAALSAWAERGSQPVHRDIDQLTHDLARFADSGVAAGEMAKAFGSDLGKLGHDFDAVALAAKKLPDFARAQGLDPNLTGPADVYGAHAKAVTDAKKSQSDISALDQALAQLATNGGAIQAKIAFDKITASLVAQGIPLDQINAQFGQYTQAASNAATANSGLAKGFGDVSGNALAMNKGLQDAIDHGQTLSDIFKQLTGAATDWAHAEDAMHQSFDDATKAIDKNGKTLDVNKQAGRDNREALLGIVSATQKAVQAKYDETGSLEQANKIYEEGRQHLIASAMQAGKTRQEAEALANQWLQMPPVVSTEVKALGVDTAHNRVLSYKQMLDDLNGKVVTTYVTVDTSTGQQQTHRSTKGFNRWGGLYEHAQDGLLSDAGIYSAREPARYAFAEPATGGEAFIPKYGDYQRSTTILDTASRWYGGRFMASGGGGGSRAVAPVVNIAPAKVTVMIGEEDVTSRVRVIVEKHDASTAAAVSGGVRY